SSECTPSGRDKIKRKYQTLCDDILVFVSSIIILLSLFAFYGDFYCFSSAVFSFFVLNIFFTIVYHGWYRHQALWLVFMLALLWISKKENFTFSEKIEKIRLWGRRSFACLIFLQMGPSVINIYNELYSTPSSNSKRFSYFLNNNQQLKNSAVISTNDLLLEGLHYYSAAPTFIMSQRKFGIVFPFAKSEKSNYSMDNVLREANLISVCNQVPVLIMVSDTFYNEHRIAPDKINYPALYHYAYLNFYIDPQQLARLQNQTHKIARFEHAANDEGFSVYQLLPKDAHSEESCSPQYIFNRKAFDLENLNK
ncbi:MAG: hypothetical protein ABF544_11805, partial [Acetobacter orientalis]|uniref:hypothetical protein n=1 Tax=Acetobacter orientalis TaxID=146474 RepID=UPI0039E88693